MLTKKNPRLGRLCAGLLMVAFFPSLSVAGDEYLTWIRHYQVAPGHEEDFIESIQEIYGPLFNRLVKDEALISWGIFTPFTHADEEWTHAIWLSYSGWSSMDKVMNTMTDREKDLSSMVNEAVSARFMKIVKPGSITDDVVRNVVVPTNRPVAASHASPAYLRVAFYKVHVGNEKSATDLYRKFAMPVYEELMSNGTVLDYALSQNEVVSDSRHTHASWVLTPNLASLDRIKSAFASAEASRPAAEQGKLIEAMREQFDMDQFRSQIFRIVHFGG